MIERVVPNKYGKFIFQLNDGAVDIYMNERYLGNTDFVDIDCASDFELLCIVNEMLTKKQEEDW